MGIFLPRCCLVEICAFTEMLGSEADHEMMLNGKSLRLFAKKFPKAAEGA